MSQQALATPAGRKTRKGAPQQQPVVAEEKTVSPPALLRVTNSVGGTSEQSISQAAAMVIQDPGTTISGSTEKEMVICRRAIPNMSGAEVHKRAGTKQKVIEVVPGCHTLLASWLPHFMPTYPRSACREVGSCNPERDVTEECGGCHNKKIAMAN